MENYKIVLYQQEAPASEAPPTAGQGAPTAGQAAWVAEIPAVPGCYALMETKEQALEELRHVFDMLAEEYQEKGLPLPKDTTEIIHA